MSVITDIYGNLSVIKDKTRFITDKKFGQEVADRA
jgi:hypothetical protein